MKAIYKKELNSYFNGMIGYVFVACTVAFIGIYFMAYNMQGGY
ncbi:MAG: ABC transporter, partial [Oscillospiraceae bacterium]|nr:ABC transporter [Oscillospiraceae bacterium]